MPGYFFVSNPVNRSSVKYAMRGALRDVTLAQRGLLLRTGNHATSLRTMLSFVEARVKEERAIDQGEQQVGATPTHRR